MPEWKEGITREGSFRIQSVDAGWYEALMGHAKPGDRLGFDVTITESHFRQRPKPSPWRHPLLWLRWNPLEGSTVVTKLQLNGVHLIEEEDDA